MGSQDGLSVGMSRFTNFVPPMGILGILIRNVISQGKRLARVDAMLNSLCFQFGSVLHVDNSAPLYTNCIGAFARSNARRNTHLWAVRGHENEFVEPSYQMGVPGEGHNVCRFGLHSENLVEDAT